jgi:hypothetical protein
MFLKRRRNSYGKKMRKLYESHQATLTMKEIRDWEAVEQDHSNTITGVQIDNLILVRHEKKH